MAQRSRQRPPSNRIDSINPAAGETIGSVPAATPESARAAVARARRAQAGWAALSARERAGRLGRLRDLVIDRSADVASLICRETGRAQLEGDGDVIAIPDACNYYARLAVELEEGRSVGSGALFGRRSHIYFRPRGVAAVISPWNAPFLIAMAQIIPALAAGNAVVHKPSERTPRVGLLIGELCRDAGVPEGVVEIVVGDGSIAAAIIDAPVDVIAFTGSPANGRKVLEAAARHLTPVVLELGGKDAAIVCDDADLERAANGITWGAFVFAGQACIGVKRAIVAESLYDRFVDMVAARARRLHPSAAPDAQVGAITLPREIDRLERQIAAAKAAGARVVAGGARVASSNGVFFAPTVVADCTPEMAVAAEETFGPLLAVLAAKDDDDAVRIANDSEFGLGGSVWTRDEGRAMRIVERLQTGTCCINDVIVQVFNPRLPFGGVKQSGYGRASGELGFFNYCNVQSVVSAWIRPRREPLWYPYSTRLPKQIRKMIGLYHGSWIQKLNRLFN